MAEVDIDPARHRFIIALDSVNSRQIGDSIGECHACLEVTASDTLIADTSGEFEASRHSGCFFHGPVPIWERYSFAEYRPIYFDVKYLYIKIKK